MNENVLKRMTDFATDHFFSNTVPKHLNCSFLTFENLSPVFARDEELAHFEETQIKFPAFRRISPSSIPLKKVAAFISLAFSSAMMLSCGVSAYITAVV